MSQSPSPVPRPAPRTRPAPARSPPWRAPLPPLAGAGLALAFVLLIGLLWPLALWQHPRVVATSQPLATALGTGWQGALRFALTALVAILLYAAAVCFARRAAGRAAVVLVLAGTLLGSLILLPINPVGAQDVYHNIADARTLWVYGDNPLVLPPNGHADDPFYPHVPAWLDYPSAYGPVWYLLAGTPLPLTGAGVWPNVVGQKLLTAAILLAVTGLVMLLAARLHPGSAPAAGVLVGWNPLLQFETAGNAHNDIVMVGFTVAALYAVSRRRWLAVFPLLALAIATKHVMVLLGPVVLVWLLRQSAVPRSVVVRSLVLGAIIGGVCYAPFLVGGVDTVAALRREASNTTSSIGAVLGTLLDSTERMQLIILPLFLAGYGLVLWHIPRNADPRALVQASFWAVFLLLVLAKWWFWPWYVLWLVPLGALLPGSRLAHVAMVFSATALLLYVPYYWLIDADGLPTQLARAATAVALPVLVALLPVRSPSSERSSGGSRWWLAGGGCLPRRRAAAGAARHKRVGA
jgi:hypothetical protein